MQHASCTFIIIIIIINLFVLYNVPFIASFPPCSCCLLFTAICPGQTAVLFISRSFFSLQFWETQLLFFLVPPTHCFMYHREMGREMGGRGERDHWLHIRLGWFFFVFRGGRGEGHSKTSFTIADSGDFFFVFSLLSGLRLFCTLPYSGGSCRLVLVLQISRNTRDCIHRRWD